MLGTHLSALARPLLYTVKGEQICINPWKVY